MTYKIKRSMTYSQHLRPSWIVILLYEVPPFVYDTCQTVEECRDKLKVILKVINTTEVIYTNKRQALRKVKQIELREDRIEIRSSYGKVQLVFKIEKIN